MISKQIAKTLVTTNNSPSQEYTNPDEQPTANNILSIYF